MKKFLHVVLSCSLIVACSNNDCANYNHDYIPTNLDHAIAYFDCNWSESDKATFANKDESTAIKEIHMGLGRGIRNSWGLWDKTSPLMQFFNSYGIYHPDDVSSIIMKSYHRKLNNKEIDFEGQVQYYLAYWKPLNEFESKETVRALKSFSKYVIGDSFTAYLEIDTLKDKNFAFNMISPEYEWSFNPDKDLKINGVLLNKNIIHDSSDVEFNIKVIGTNRAESIRTAWGEVQKGDTVRIGIKYLKYE